MFYRHDMSQAFPNSDLPVGKYQSAAADAARSLASRLCEPTYNCLNLALQDADLAPIEALAADWRLRYRDVIVIGIGGSSLGARSLVEPLGGARPRLIFVDNVEVLTLEPLLRGLDAARTGLLLVSKSGSTAEVLAQALVALRHFEASLGRERIAGHVAAITGPGQNALRQLAGRWSAPVFDHDPHVDGRYSVLTNVGLLPAFLAGIDAQAVRIGARSVIEALRAAPDQCPAAAGAAWQVAYEREGRAATTVLVPYDARLANLAKWHRQIWAESLGKNGGGLTPQAALGPVDQHSQLQQWLDGMPDKVFTVVVPELAGQGATIPSELLADGLDYLKGRTLGDLVAAEARATLATLARNHRPLRTIWLPKIDAATLGALFAHYIVETILAAALLGVDPFGQPAVEEGKTLTREYLRSGRVR
ncbi:MAG: glucose-6-phosphate isomerase [Alphaproteobacteria bacterium]|nr:glucose-6-phosphate isomerase [Alphaproteobacteria bacterium]